MGGFAALPHKIKSPTLQSIYCYDLTICNRMFAINITYFSLAMYYFGGLENIFCTSDGR